MSFLLNHLERLVEDEMTGKPVNLNKMDRLARLLAVCVGLPKDEVLEIAYTEVRHREQRY